MKNLLLTSVLVLLTGSIACDATSTDPPPDGGAAGASGAGRGGSSAGSGGSPAGSGGSPPDAGPPKCTTPGALSVEQDGESLEVERVRSAAEWTTYAGREVFRLRLETSHDPVPEAVDDEFALTTVIELVPSELLQQRGDSLVIDQQITTPKRAPHTGFVDDPSLEVRSNAGHDAAIGRVLVQQSGFGTSPEATSYHVVGELALRMTDDHRVQGTVTLDIDGRVPLAFGGTQTRITGCFDLTAVAPAGCQPGEECGNDCIAPEEWPCWACGSLYVTHDCACRPDIAPLDECSTSAEPAGEGELCGEQWWCERTCADGLLCAPDSTYGGSEEDAGVGDACEHYTTCQRP
jgi:hypothetical protein